METMEEMRALIESIRNDIKKLEDQISAVDTLLHRFDQCHHQSSIGSYAQRRNNSLEYYKKQYEALHGKSTDNAPTSRGFDEVDWDPSSIQNGSFKSQLNVITITVLCRPISEWPVWKWWVSV